MNLRRSRSTSRHHFERVFLTVRGTALRGSAVSCPLCRRSFRHYVHGGGSWAPRDRGYCPGCNAKARHRRAWYHIEEMTSILTEPGATLLIAPKPCEVAAFGRRHIMPVSIDLSPGSHTTHVGDVTQLPFDDSAFKYIVCIHVLEHVADDVAAMAELSRVLTADGVLVLSVPSQLDVPTHEDASIVLPKERIHHFGEADHHRLYGFDITDRLEAHGLICDIHRATDLETTVVDRYGITLDEHIFECTRARTSTW
jgi:SAM-dependent methyltransferase